MKALIHGRRVCQVVKDEDLFPVSAGLKWVDCPMDITDQHTYEKGRFVDPPPSGLRVPIWNGVEWIDENPLTVQEKRQQEYESTGCSVNDLIVALWEKIVENRPEEATDIQAKREAVKAKFPKQ
ncbi:hypothetical protein KKE60_06745 [Patescibacteria group bacterium]|nr:hypothetical protein [Patescibacteria group bacterium]